MAICGKEDGVDQFGFAARKFGNESDVEAVFAQFFEQLPDAQVDLSVGQVVVGKPDPVRVQPGRKL